MRKESWRGRFFLARTALFWIIQIVVTAHGVSGNVFIKRGSSTLTKNQIIFSPTKCSLVWERMNPRQESVLLQSMMLEVNYILGKIVNCNNFKLYLSLFTIVQSSLPYSPKVE